MTYLDHFISTIMGEFERTAILEVRAHRTSGVEELTFNVSNVTLDFDAQTATVDDELDATVSDTIALGEFFKRVEAARPR